MTGSYTTLVLDREQLREVTFDDEDLMRQLLAALIEDTEKQVPHMRESIQRMDAAQTARLAHYCKGACANIGAKAAAEVLKTMEQLAAQGSVEKCGWQVQALAMELDRLRAEKI